LNSYATNNSSRGNSPDGISYLASQNSKHACARRENSGRDPSDKSFIEKKANIFVSIDDPSQGSNLENTHGH
jgi:hypothetical protein